MLDKLIVRFAKQLHVKRSLRPLPETHNPTWHASSIFSFRTRRTFCLETLEGGSLEV